jgi:amino acid transporter
MRFLVSMGISGELIGISAVLVSLISVLSSSKSMEIREYLPDIILTVIMVVSTLVLILRFWQDLTIAVAAALMMLSIGGLFLSLQVKMRRLEQSVITRERMLRTNLEEISTRMVDKYDLAISHLDELVAAMARRAYK